MIKDPQSFTGSLIPLFFLRFLKRTATENFLISASDRCNRNAEQINMRMGPANRIFRPQPGQHIVVVAAAAEVKCLLMLNPKTKTA